MQKHAVTTLLPACCKNWCGSLQRNGLAGAAMPCQWPYNHTIYSVCVWLSTWLYSFIQVLIYKSSNLMKITRACVRAHNYVYALQIHSLMPLWFHVINLQFSNFIARFSLLLLAFYVDLFICSWCHHPTHHAMRTSIFFATLNE